MDATLLRFRHREVMEEEEDFATEVACHPELGDRAAVQLRRVFATGTQIFFGLDRHQVGLMRVLAAKRGIEIPF